MDTVADVHLYTALLVCLLALAVVYVVRGRRRGDAPLKILNDSLLIGMLLLISLAHIVPRTKVVALVGAIAFVSRMLWNIVRSRRR